MTHTMVTLLIGLSVWATPLAADVVLLDEYWTPDITANEVQATEIDTQQTRDSTQAKFGECSALLENEVGWPSVRFLNAAALRLSGVPAEESDVRLWYRTDNWAGKWTLEVWAFRYQVTDRPVNVLQAELDGGGEDGRLIADNGWHEAHGVLIESDEYGMVPPDEMVATYVWLKPTDGWDVPHHTYVDRIEIDVLTDEEAPPEPARRVRPDPGAQVTGDGWVWWEAEDAIEHTFPPGGTYLPHSVPQQAVLSNGGWLQCHGGTGPTAKWELSVAEAGSYTLWCRGMMYAERMRWRFGTQAWQVSVGQPGPLDVQVVRDMDGRLIHDSWYRLGAIDLPPGKQTFEIEALPELRSVALDCFLLTRNEFTPDGAKKPGGE